MKSLHVNQWTWGWEKKWNGRFESLWISNTAPPICSDLPAAFNTISHFLYPRLSFPHSVFFAIQPPSLGLWTLGSSFLFPFCSMEGYNPLSFNKYLWSTVCVSHISWNKGERRLKRANYSGAEPLKRGRQIVNVIGAAVGACPEDMC